MVTLNGDTVKGKINYREWSFNPDKVEFQPADASSVTKQLNPADTRKFVIFNLETYQSYTGPISADRSLTSPYLLDLNAAKDTNKITRSVSLKLFMTGKYVSLYTYKDKDKIRYFSAEESKTPLELDYHQIYDESTRQIKSIEVFKSQLIALTSRYSNEPIILEKVQEVKYDDTELLAYLDLLNKATSTSKDLNRHPFTTFFAGVSADITTTNYAKRQNSGANTEVPSTSIMPGLTGGFDVYLNPNVQRFIFRSELSVSYNHFTADNLYPNIRLELNQVTFAFSPMFIYNLYNTDNFKVFIGGGIGFNYGTKLQLRVVMPHFLHG